MVYNCINDPRESLRANAAAIDAWCNAGTGSTWAGFGHVRNRTTPSPHNANARQTQAEANRRCAWRCGTRCQTFTVPTAATPTIAGADGREAKGMHPCEKRSGVTMTVGMRMWQSALSLMAHSEREPPALGKR